MSKLDELAEKYRMCHARYQDLAAMERRREQDWKDVIARMQSVRDEIQSISNQILNEAAGKDEHGNG